MAVFKQEMQWSTYQDKQLKVLESLEKSFQNSLKLSLSVNSSISSIAIAVNEIARGITTNFSNRVQQSGIIVENSFRNLAHSIENQSIIYDSTGKVLSDLQKQAEDAAEALRRSTDEEAERKRKEEEAAEEFSAALQQVVRDVLNYGEKLGRVANTYSTIDNQIMKLTGVDSTTSGQFRDSLVHDIVTGLNQDTGGRFNPQELYSLSASLANQVGIGNLETLEEIMRPVALASESMDLHIGELSTLLARWNTRYNFSSLAMEDIVNDIRNSTAGNQATAEATLQNLSRLENWTAYYANGDESTMTAMSKAISHGTAYLESMGVSSSRYTDYIADIASGEAHTNTQLIQVLKQSGISANQAQKMFAEGRIDELYNALLVGESGIIQRLKDSGTDLYGPAAEAFGFEVADILDAYNATTSENFKPLNEFINSIGDTTAAEAINQQYVGLGERIENWLMKAGTYLADIQEQFGFGLTDVASLVYLVQGIHGFSKSVGQLLGAGGSSGGTIASAGGVAGVLGKIGGALGATGTGAVVAGGATVAAVLAAVAAVVYSINASISSIKELADKEWGDGLGGVADTALGQGDRVVWEKSTTRDKHGNWVDSYAAKSVTDEEYMKNKALYDEAERAYLASTASDVQTQGYWSGIGDFLSARFAAPFQAAYNYVTGDQDKASLYMGAARDAWIPGGGARAGIRNFLNLLPQGARNQVKSWNLPSFLDPYGGTSYADASRNAGKLNNMRLQDYLEKYAGSDVVQETAAAYLAAKAYENSLDGRLRMYQDIEAYGLAEALDKHNLVYLNGEWYDAHSVSEFAMQGYRTGTNYISRDQVAILHEGEAVVPKAYNPAANKNELELLREYVQQKSESSASESAAYLQEAVVALQSIQEFLVQWQKDNLVQSSIEENRSRFKYASMNIAGFNLG